MQPNPQPMQPNRPEYYRTPWEKHEHGVKKRIELFYNPASKKVTVKQLEQTRLDRFLNRIASFISGSDRESTTHFKTTRKVYSNVNPEDFASEKEILDALIAAKTSVEDLITQIENQLTISGQEVLPPTDLTPPPQRPPAPTRPLPDIPQPPRAPTPPPEPALPPTRAATPLPEPVLPPSRSSTPPVPSISEREEDETETLEIPEPDAIIPEEIPSEEAIIEPSPPERSQTPPPPADIVIPPRAIPKSEKPDMRSSSSKSSDAIEDEEPPPEFLEGDHLSEDEIEEELAETSSSKIDEEKTEELTQEYIEPEPEPAPVPLITSEQIKEREEELKGLRAKLEQLDREIADTSAQSGRFTKIQSTIAKLRSAVESSFAAITQLESHVKDPGEEVDGKIKSLKKTAALDTLSDVVHQAREVVVKELELEQQADALTESIKSLPELLKEQWASFVDEWKEKASGIDLKGNARIEERRKELEDGFNQLKAEFLASTIEKVENKKAALIGKTKVLGIDLSVPLEEDAPPFIKFQRSLVDQRLTAWDELIARCQSLSNDLNAVVEAAQAIDSMASGNEAILALITPKDKGITTRIFEKWSSYWAPLSQLIFEPRNELVARLAETDALYIEKIVESIATLKRNLSYMLEAIHERAGPEKLDEEYDKCSEAFDQKSLYLPGIKTYLDSIANDVDAFLKDGTSTAHDRAFVRNTWHQVHSIVNALPTLIHAENDVKLQFTEDVKAAYPYLFSDDNHPQIRQLGERALKQIEERSDFYGDLSSYYTRLEELKSAADSQLALIAATAKISDIHAKYEEIYGQLDEESKQLTGPEIKSGAIALERLSLILEKLAPHTSPPLDLKTCGEEFILHDLARQWENTLKLAVKQFELVKEVEQKKEEVRKEIAKYVEESTPAYEDKLSELEEIEEALGEKLDDVRLAITDSKAALEREMEQGRFERGSFLRAPMRRIGELTFWYERKPEGEFAVEDLSIINLDEYLQKIKQDIAEEKRLLDEAFPFEKLRKLIDRKNTKVEEARERIRDLEGDFSVRNPANRRKERLQFANANELRKGVDAVEKSIDGYLETRKKAHEEAVKASEEKPPIPLMESQQRQNTVKVLAAKLRAEIDRLNEHVGKSEKARSLTLIEQIKIFEDNENTLKAAKKTIPEEDRVSLKAAKQALLEDNQRRMEEHATTAKETMDALTGYGDIHQEAGKILEKSQAAFAKKLGKSPLANRAANMHAPSLTPDEKPETEEISLDSLTHTQFIGFEREFTDAVYRDRLELKTLQRVQDRAAKSTQTLIDIQNEAAEKLVELEASDQLVKMLELQSRIDIINASTLREAKPPKEGWFQRWFGAKTAPVAVYGPSVALEKFTKANGQKIAQFTGAIKYADNPIIDANKKPVVTLAEQLRYVSPAHAAHKPLMDRLKQRSIETLEEAQRNLTSFANLADRLVGEMLPLEQQISADISGKMRAKADFLNKLGEEFQIKTGWFGWMTTIKTDDIDDKDKTLLFHEKVREAVESAKALMKQYPVEKVDAAFTKFNEAKKKVEGEIASYKKDGFYEYAFDLEWYYQLNQKLIDQPLAKKNLSTKEFLELEKTLEKATKDLVLEKSKVIADKVAQHKRLKTRNGLEVQLITFVAYKEKSYKEKFVQGDQQHKDNFDKLVDSYIGIIKSDIARQISKTYKDQRDFLASLLEKEEPKPGENEPSAPDAVTQLCTRFNLTPRLRNEAYKVINTEARKFTKVNPSIAVGKKWIFLTTDKTVTAMSPEEIIRTRPLTTITGQVQASEAALRSVIDIKGLQEASIAFDEAVEKAHELVKKYEKDHAYSKAIELKKLINNLEGQVDRYGQDNTLNTKEDVDTLIDYIRDTLIELNDGIAAIKSKKQGSLVEQIKLIQAIEPHSPHLKILSSAFVEEIHNKIASHQGEIEQRIGYKTTGEDISRRRDERDRLVPRGGISPIAAIARDLNAPAGWAEAFSAVIKEQLEPYDDLLKPQKIDGKTVTFIEFPLKTLMQVNTEVDERIRVNTHTLDKLKLNLLDSAYKAYQKELQACKEQKEDWKNEYRIDAADEVENLIFESDFKFRNFFQQHLKYDPKVNIDSLRKQLEHQRQFLVSGMKEIRKDMPATYGAAIQTMEMASPAYTKGVESILSNARDRLKQQESTLYAYHKSLSGINQSLSSLFDDQVSISNEWGELVGNYLESCIEDLSMLHNEFPVFVKDKKTGKSELKYIPLEQLSKERLLDYETLVNDLTGATKKGKKDAARHIESVIESRMNLKAIESSVTAFLNMVNSVESSWKDRDGPREKELRSLINAQKRLIAETVKGMTCLEDSIALADCLKQAQLTLDRSIIEINNSRPLILDPWSQLLYDELEHAAVNRGNLQKIFSEGFTIEVAATDPHHPSLSYHGKSIDHLIRDGVKKLESYGEYFSSLADQWLADGVPADSPQITNLMAFASTGISSKIAELRDLSLGMRERLDDGSIAYISRVTMNSFEQAVKYRMYVIEHINPALDYCERLFEQMPVYIKYIQPPKETPAAGAPAAGIAAPREFIPPADLLRPSGSSTAPAGAPTAPAAAAKGPAAPAPAAAAKGAPTPAPATPAKGPARTHSPTSMKVPSPMTKSPPPAPSKEAPAVPKEPPKVIVPTPVPPAAPAPAKEAPAVPKEPPKVIVPTPVHPAAPVVEVSPVPSKWGNLWKGFDAEGKKVSPAPLRFNIPTPTTVPKVPPASAYRDKLWSELEKYTAGGNDQQKEVANQLKVVIQTLENMGGRLAAPGQPDSGLTATLGLTIEQIANHVQIKGSDNLKTLTAALEHLEPHENERALIASQYETAITRSPFSNAIKKALINSINVNKKEIDLYAPMRDIIDGFLDLLRLIDRVEVLSSIGENLDKAEKYCHVIDNLLPENAELTEHRVNIKGQYLQLRDGLNADNVALVQEKSAELRASIERYERIILPLSESLAVLQAQHRDYRTLAATNLALLNNALARQDARAQTKVHEIYALELPTTELDFATATTNDIRKHFQKFDRADDLINRLRGIAPMLSNLYQTLDRIKTELVQSRSLTDQTKTLEDKLTSLLAKRPVDLAKLPSELQDLLVDATTVETEWRAYAQASATPAAMLATPLELLQSRYEQFTNYALQNHPRIDLDFIHHLQPAGEIKQADLPNLIAAFNALEQHLDKVEEISQSLDALVAMLPGFKVIENARDRLADQLKRILEVKAPDELNSLSDKLDSLKANIAGEQEKWKDAAASKQAYDAKVATLNNGIAHWQGKNRPDLVDQLRNLYASVRSAQEEFLRLRQAADPAAVAGRFAEDRENLSINARKITADAPIAITEASVQEKYSGRFQEIAGYLQQFESKANGIPAILTAHQAFVRELERIMKPSTFNEFDAIPSRLIQLEKDLSDAVEDMPWQTYLHFEIVRPNYLRNMYGDWIDPVQVILARLKPASDVKAINQAYATLQTELKDILAPQTRDELDKIADRLDQLILKAEAEIKKWEPVLAPRQMYIQGVAKYTREKNTWKDLNRLDVVESLQKAYMDIKDSQHTFLEQSNNPAAISRRYEEDLVKLTNAIDEVIASVDTSKASVPTSGSRQYVEYRDNVIADVKKRVGVLKEMIRTIRDNLPARSPNNSQRDDTLNGILGIVKDYTGDTFAQKKLLRTVTTPVNALSGEDFELYRSEFDAAYREALQKLESIEKTAQFVNSHALYLRVASSLDDRQNLVLKSLTDLAQTPGVYFNYFIQDQILRNREALDRARDTLAASLRNNTGFDALNEECKTFKAAWEAYEASLSQATREGYLPDIMEQLKLEQAHPGTLSDASRTTIIGALENYTNKLISEAEAIMTAQFRVEGDFPELKRYFDERVKQNIASITAQLGDRKEILESLDLEKIDELWKEIHQLYRDNTFKEQLQHKTEELKVILSKNREQREAIATHLKNFRENRQFWLAIDLSQACKEAEEALRDAEDKLKVGNYNAYLQALRSFNTALETGLKSIRALMNKPKSLEDQKTYIETTFKGKFNALEDYKALKRALVGTRSKP